jgi:hypothetical protein
MTLGRDRQPPGGSEVQRLRIAPDLAHHAAQALASEALLHRPQGGLGVPCLHMDEFTGERSQAGGMDPPALQDRHPFLHPQQGLAGTKLGKDEARPAGIARGPGKEFGKGRSSLFGKADGGGGSAQR